MPPARKRATPEMKAAAEEALAALERMGTRKTLEEMPVRYGIHVKKAFGVKVGDIQKLARGIGRDHELALALWETGWYEARLLASFVDEPARVTPRANGPLVPRFRQLGHRGHGVLQIVRPVAARLRQSAAVGGQT